MQSHILASLLLVLALSTDFNITTTSTCSAFSANGAYCTKWEQHGRVVEDYGSCFPAHSLVKTPEGLIRIDNLKVGDLVLGFAEGKEVFT